MSTGERIMVSEKEIEAAWHKARNAWLSHGRHQTQAEADAEAVKILHVALEAAASAREPEGVGVAERCAQIADDLASDELFLDEKGRFGAELAAASIRAEFNLSDEGPALSAPIAEDGMVLVPREPTQKMLNATDMDDRIMAVIYRAMIAASEQETDNG